MTESADQYVERTTSCKFNLESTGTVDAYLDLHRGQPLIVVSFGLPGRLEVMCFKLKDLLLAQVNMIMEGDEYTQETPIEDIHFDEYTDKESIELFNKLILAIQNTCTEVSNQAWGFNAKD